MKLVKTKFDFYVEMTKADSREIIPEGTILKVNCFDSFSVFLNPSFEITDDKQPLNGSVELGISVNPDIFSCCFDVLSDEEIKRLKF